MFLLEFHVRYYIFRGIFRIFVISKIFISNKNSKFFFTLYKSLIFYSYAIFYLNFLITNGCIIVYNVAFVISLSTRERTCNM